MRRKFAGCRTMGEFAKGVPGASFEDMKFVKPSTIPEPTRSMLLSAKDGDMLPPATTTAGVELYAVCGRRAVAATTRSETRRRKNCSPSNWRSSPSATCATSARTRTSSTGERCARRPKHAAYAAPLAVTMGDPAGIGPDITLMSWLCA